MVVPDVVYISLQVINVIDIEKFVFKLIFQKKPNIFNNVFVAVTLLKFCR